MPTYEYRCGACGHRFERFQKMSDDPVRTCPDCGEDEAERLISPGGGLVFKGSGFYATDYRDSGPGPGAGEGGAGDAGEADAASGGEDSARDAAGDGSSGEGSSGEGEDAGGG